MRAIHGFQPRAWQDPLDQGLLACVQSADFDQVLSALNTQSAQRGLVSGLGKPLQFVAQESLPIGQAYETIIAETGRVPTRDNFHDRYNALMWLTAPHTKACLNRMQHAEIQRLGGATQRGRLRDALTLWDENLAVVVARCHADLLGHCLKQHDWSDLFFKHRANWGVDWYVRVFGHALLEKLRLPYKAITAHVVVIAGDRTDWHGLDAMLCDWLSDRAQQEALTPKVLLPLPVMGIPGWCSENEAPEFYQDTAVFR